MQASPNAVHFATSKWCHQDRMKSYSFCYPESHTILTSEVFSLLNPGLSYRPRSDKKEQRGKNKDGTPSSSLRSYLSVLILSSAESVTHQWTVKTGSFFICCFELISQCHHSRNHYDTSLFFPPLIINAPNLNFLVLYRYKGRGLYLLFSGVYIIEQLQQLPSKHLLSEGLRRNWF